MEFINKNLVLTTPNQSMAIIVINYIPETCFPLYKYD